MNNLDKYRKDTVFSVISELLKCNTAFDVVFVCGDERYKPVTITEDIATKTVLVDMKETQPPDLADKYYRDILDKFRDSPVTAAKSFSKEDLVNAIDWALKYIDKLENVTEED